MPWRATRRSRVVRPARPRAACVRPTDAPGRAAAASDRVALNRLSAGKHAIRGAAPARAGRVARAPVATPVPR